MDTQNLPIENQTPTEPATVSTDSNTTPIASLKQEKKINPKYVAAAVIGVIVLALAFQYKQLLVAATVDGRIINRLSVIKKLEKQNGQSALNSLIEDQLISNAAAKNNINVTDGDINGKIASISTQIENAGGTLEQALAQAGMSQDDLKYEVAKQLRLERLLGDKLNVSDEEINKYIADNKVTVEQGKEEETKNKIRDQLRSDKFNAEAGKYLSDLRTNAKIRTFVEY